MTELPQHLDASVVDRMATEAMQVLRNNILHTFTKPCPNLYPHQWNWDAGFIALGYMRSDFRQACSEMTALFRGQWENGMTPQIVFSVKSMGKYFPGYTFWKTKGVPGKPPRVRTSGITMPAVHGFVLQRMLQHAPDVKKARPYFRRMAQKVFRLHQYLYDFRDPDREGLAFICHPWESGMDNLPSWEEVFTRIHFEPSEVPSYRRRDLNHVDAPYRPRNHSYDRYIYLVNRLRKMRYKEPEVWQDYPFQVQEPLFNAILNYSNEALLELFAWLRLDSGQIAEWQAQTKKALNDKLWDEERGLFVSFDRVQKQPVRIATAAGLTPLLCGAPDEARAARMVSVITGTSFSGTHDNPAWLCASTALDEPGFDSRRYWRGPVWININWLLYHGLRRYGYDALAGRIRSESLELVQQYGFWEYYNPLKNLPATEDQAGHGAHSFSWTAALTLDWLGR